MNANEDLLEKRYWSNESLVEYHKDIDTMMLTAEGDKMASEIPLCFGSEQHSDKSLICKRCPFEYKCYLAWNKRNKQ